MGRICPRRSDGPIFYRVSYKTLYAHYTQLVEEFSWSPADCKALVVRERKYWLEYLTYKRKMEQYRRMMIPSNR